MADDGATSPKRRREDDDDVGSPPRKRSASHTPPNGSPGFRLAERPRRYSRDVGEEDDRGYYRDRRSPRSGSRSHTPSHTPSHSRSRSGSRTSSQRRSRSPQVTPPPPKPTQLHYKQSLILRGHKKGVTSVKFSPDGRWIASSSADCSKAISPASPPYPGRPTPESSPPAQTTNR
jgi:COMPASS component SWD3